MKFEFRTITVFEAVAEPPPESLVVSVTTYEPPPAKTCVTGLPLDVPLSPKFQPKV